MWCRHSNFLLRLTISFTVRLSIGFMINWLFVWFIKCEKMFSLLSQTRETQNIFTSNHLNKHHAAVQTSVDWTFRSWLIINIWPVVGSDTLSSLSCFWNIIRTFYLSQETEASLSLTNTQLLLSDSLFLSLAVLFSYTSSSNARVEENDCCQEQQITYSRSVAHWNMSTSTWLWWN